SSCHPVRSIYARRKHTTLSTSARFCVASSEIVRGNNQARAATASAVPSSSPVLIGVSASSHGQITAHLPRQIDSSHHIQTLVTVLNSGWPCASLVLRSCACTYT